MCLALRALFKIGSTQSNVPCREQTFEEESSRDPRWNMLHNLVLRICIIFIGFFQIFNSFIWSSFTHTAIQRPRIIYLTKCNTCICACIWAVLLRGPVIVLACRNTVTITIMVPTSGLFIEQPMFDSNGVFIYINYNWTKSSIRLSEWMLKLFTFFV